MEDTRAGSFFEIPQGLLQVVFQCVETVKCPVVKRLLAQFIPQTFDRVRL